MAAKREPAVSPNAGESSMAQRPDPGPIKVHQIVRSEKAAKGIAPNFVWKDADGTERSLKDYQGKVVLLNFWATWCPPCRRELPDMVKLREEMASEGFEIIGVSVSEEPPPGKTIAEHVAAFARTQNMKYPLLISDDDLPNLYGGINGIPTTFIINGKGEIVKTLVGGQSGETFRREVKAAM